MKPVRRPRRRWENNIKMVIKQTGREIVGWIHLAQNGDQWWAPVNTVTELWVP
jgi:hypothetical protein